MTNTSKIISRFYVIYGDNTPIYVGYTNRTVKQRFKEHKDDKDFSSYNKVEVKEIDKLEFDFTWDMSIVNDNARKVSDRESMLINRYDTGNSIYQKGLGDIKGGQTWSSVKGFVHNNKNNPKYTGMSSEELLGYLDNYRRLVSKLSGFITSYQDFKVSKLKNFVSDYKDKKVSKLHVFIKNYQDPEVSKIKDFIKNYQDPKVLKLTGFISSYKDSKILKLSTFISHYQDPKISKLNNFITKYQDPKVSSLANFISHYQNFKVSKLSHFISHYQDPKISKLNNFISHYRNNSWQSGKHMLVWLYKQIGEYNNDRN